MNKRNDVVRVGMKKSSEGKGNDSMRGRGVLLCNNGEFFFLSGGILRTIIIVV